MYAAGETIIKFMCGVARQLAGHALLELRARRAARGSRRKGVPADSPRAADPTAEESAAGWHQMRRGRRRAPWCAPRQTSPEHGRAGGDLLACGVVRGFLSLFVLAERPSGPACRS